VGKRKHLIPSQGRGGVGKTRCKQTEDLTREEKRAREVRVEKQKRGAGKKRKEKALEIGFVLILSTMIRSGTGDGSAKSRRRY